jgi:NitT/TauT family transport system permease protein
MTDATLGDIPTRLDRLWLSKLVRPTINFLLVAAVFILIWQGIKWRFNLDDRTLPHIGDIFQTFFKPVSAGKPILAQLLLEHTLFTLLEAVFGFALGSTIGFLLAVVFAHSRLLERGLMPFVVASQTVPVLAIAPMVVVWLYPTASKFAIPWMPVAVIAAYLTFFPVTINTLRGLISIPPTALELMESYAATRWQTLVKLRIPHALPYIFTALKVSATASVVGSIIGELPSGIQNGLGGMIINFSQSYATQSVQLWATNLVAALAGMAAFGAVALAERLIVRWSSAHRSK